MDSVLSWAWEADGKKRVSQSGVHFKRVRESAFDGKRERELESVRECAATSVTRLGNLLDFGQIFKAFGNNYFAQISHILRQFL